MPFEVEDLSGLSFVGSDRRSYEDYGITGTNFDETESYMCEYDHVGSVPALLNHSVSYNPSTSEFEIKGILVYICPTCRNPVFKDTGL